MEFVRRLYRHGKAILALEGAEPILAAARLFPDSDTDATDPGLLVDSGKDRATLIQAFSAAIASHRQFERLASQGVGMA
jgi:hypothetical protein